MICDKHQCERKTHWFPYAIKGETNNARVEHPFVVTSKNNDISALNITFFFPVYKSRFHGDVLNPNPKP